MLMPPTGALASGDRRHSALYCFLRCLLSVHERTNHIFSKECNYELHITLARAASRSEVYVSVSFEPLRTLTHTSCVRFRWGARYCTRNQTPLKDSRQLAITKVFGDVCSQTFGKTRRGCSMRLGNNSGVYFTSTNDDNGLAILTNAMASTS